MSYCVRCTSLRVRLAPVAQQPTHIARRTLSDVRLTQYDMLPQH